jgi:8-oxo-dGTP pyrophosphatase MutT (NUDIX family)
MTRTHGRAPEVRRRRDPAPARDLPSFLARKLGEHPAAARPEWEVTQAAVLLPLYQDCGAWWLLYTRRTDSVDVHRGQVSFPGGRIDAGDHGPEGTALREAEEEVGLSPGEVEVLGTLTPLLTVTQFEVTPVVGRISRPSELRLNTREVACAFGVPLPWLADPAHLHHEQRMPPLPGREILVYSFDPYLGETIWGATARITLDLLAVVRGFAPE